MLRKNDHFVSVNWLNLSNQIQQLALRYLQSIHFIYRTPRRGNRYRQLPYLDQISGCERVSRLRDWRQFHWKWLGAGYGNHLLLIRLYRNPIPLTFSLEIITRFLELLQFSQCRLHALCHLQLLFLIIPRLLFHTNSSFIPCTTLVSETWNAHVYWTFLLTNWRSHQYWNFWTSHLLQTVQHQISMCSLTIALMGNAL